jgi:hypothetical protein
MAKRKPKVRDVREAAYAVVQALARGEYLRGAKSSIDAGKTWQNAPYLPDLLTALADDGESIKPLARYEFEPPPEVIVDTDSKEDD